MRVVITGATGNVGSSLVEALSREPAVDEIIGVARRATTWDVAKTRFVAADVTKDDLVTTFRGADVVVHLAWLFQPTHSPLVTWHTNVEGSLRVFSAAAEAGARALVHASSVGAYSPAVRDQFVDESWPTHSMPTAAYGREKAYVERALDAFEARHSSVRVVRLRPAFIFKRASGTEQRRLFAGPFLPRILARPGVLPFTPHPPELRFQALHSADAAEAYRLAVVRDGARGAFNIAADPVIDGNALAGVLEARPVRVPRVVVRNAAALAWKLHLVPAEPALIDLFLSLPLLDTTRARTELGWAPTRSGTDAMREMFEGMAAGEGGATPPLAADSVVTRAREVMTGVGERP